MPRKPNPNPCYYKGTKLNDPLEVAYAKQLLSWSKSLGEGEGQRFGRYSAKKPLVTFLLPGAAETFRPE